MEQGRGFAFEAMRLVKRADVPVCFASADIGGWQRRFPERGVADAFHRHRCVAIFGVVETGGFQDTIVETNVFDSCLALDVGLNLER